MATFQELKEYYEKEYNQTLRRETLSRWVKNKEVKAIKQENGVYNYDFISFKEKIHNSKKSIIAKKSNPKDFIGKKCGFLLIKSIVPKQEYKQKYNGTLMYCDCLHCGTKNIQVRFSYLTGKGNYTQTSCGCYRKIKAFMTSTSFPNTEEKWLTSFKDFNKFLFIYKALTHTGNINLFNHSIDDFKQIIEFFYNQKQFNLVYNFWKNNKKRSKTFYDLAKPSLDHIIPKSKGGTDTFKNIQFLTVFENLAKRDMSMEEWKQFKKETQTTSKYFIEQIEQEGREG